MAASWGQLTEPDGQQHPQKIEVKVHCLYRDDEMIYTYHYDNGRTSLSRSRRTDKEAC